MRLSAGCNRICKASKASRPSTSMSSSPSRTNRSAASEASIATTSGKYRPSGLPDLARKSTVLPALKARHRKPSHLGSYCQRSAPCREPLCRLRLHRRRLERKRELSFLLRLRRRFAGRSFLLVVVWSASDHDAAPFSGFWRRVNPDGRCRSGDQFARVNHNVFHFYADRVPLPRRLIASPRARSPSQ